MSWNRLTVPPLVPDRSGTHHTPQSSSSAVTHLPDLTDRRVLDSPHLSRSGWRDPVALVPSGPNTTQPDSELQDWTLTGPEGGEGREHPPQTPLHVPSVHYLGI